MGSVAIPNLSRASRKDSSARVPREGSPLLNEGLQCFNLEANRFVEIPQLFSARIPDKSSPRGASLRCENKLRPPMRACTDLILQKHAGSRTLSAAFVKPASR